MPLTAAGRPFLKDVHDFRGIAIAWIVAGHSLLALDWDGEDPAARLLAVLLLNGSVLFVFIAGYLFQHLSGDYRFGPYLLRKLRFIVVPYLIVSVPAIAVSLWRADPGAGGARMIGDLALEVARCYLTGDHLEPMWFIPMICLFYAASPLLLLLDRWRFGYWLLVPLLVVSALVPRLHTDVPQTAVHFLSVYVIGMCFRRHRGRAEAIVRRWTIPMVVLAVVAIAAEMRAPPRVADALNLLQKLLVCGLLAGWLGRAGRWVPAAVGYLATLSFGIYFVHFYLVKAARVGAHALWAGGLPGNAATLALVFVAVTGLSVALLEAARRTLGPSSRLVVGC